MILKKGKNGIENMKISDLTIDEIIINRTFPTPVYKQDALIFFGMRDKNGYLNYIECIDEKSADILFELIDKAISSGTREEKLERILKEEE